MGVRVYGLRICTECQTPNHSRVQCAQALKKAWLSDGDLGRGPRPWAQVYIVEGCRCSTCHISRTAKA